MKNLIILFIFLLVSCNHKKVPKTLVSDTIKHVTTEKKLDLSDSIVTIKQEYKYGSTNKWWNKTITLPDSGKFTEESHYVTTNDTFYNNDGFPKLKNEKIEQHLKRAFEIYKKYDSTATFENIYAKHWQKEWTPEENGHFGEGCRGEYQKKNLTSDCELWMMNMMWAKGYLPKPGTKYLVSANHKMVVVIGGYETGPSDKIFLGGLTGEVHRWLGTNTNSIIKIQLLKDQNIAVGPIQTK